MVDAMAANSGGIEWSAVLKPFLSYRKDNANQSELIELCSTIVKRYVLKYFWNELTFQCQFGVNISVTTIIIKHGIFLTANLKYYAVKNEINYTILRFWLQIILVSTLIIVSSIFLEQFGYVSNVHRMTKVFFCYDTSCNKFLLLQCLQASWRLLVQLVECC